MSTPTEEYYLGQTPPALNGHWGELETGPSRIQAQESGASTPSVIDVSALRFHSSFCSVP